MPEGAGTTRQFEVAPDVASAAGSGVAVPGQTVAVIVASVVAVLALVVCVTAVSVKKNLEKI